MLIATKSDERVADLLREYNSRNITNRVTIAEMLLQEHGIKMR